jgi:Lauroyl/myristoyl acyltransferase
VESPQRLAQCRAHQPGQVFPEMDPVAREQLVGQALRDIGKSFVESACAWIWPPQRSLELVKEVHGLEVLEQALASGKGVVASPATWATGKC